MDEPSRLVERQLSKRSDDSETMTNNKRQMDIMMGRLEKSQLQRETLLEDMCAPGSVQAMQQQMQAEIAEWSELYMMADIEDDEELMSYLEEMKNARSNLNGIFLDLVAHSQRARQQKLAAVASKAMLAFAGRMDSAFTAMKKQGSLDVFDKLIEELEGGSPPVPEDVNPLQSSETGTARIQDKSSQTITGDDDCAMIQRGGGLALSLNGAGVHGVELPNTESASQSSLTMHDISVLEERLQEAERIIDEKEADIANLREKWEVAEQAMERRLSVVDGSMHCPHCGKLNWATRSASSFSESHPERVGDGDESRPSTPRLEGQGWAEDLVPETEMVSAAIPVSVEDLPQIAEESRYHEMHHPKTVLPDWMDHLSPQDLKVLEEAVRDRAFGSGEGGSIFERLSKQSDAGALNGSCLSSKEGFSFHQLEQVIRFLLWEDDYRKQALITGISLASTDLITVKKYYKKETKSLSDDIIREHVRYMIMLEKLLAKWRASDNWWVMGQWRKWNGLHDALALSKLSLPRYKQLSGDVNRQFRRKVAQWKERKQMFEALRCKTERSLMRGLAEQTSRLMQQDARLRTNTEIQQLSSAVYPDVGILSPTQPALTGRISDVDGLLKEIYARPPVTPMGIFHLLAVNRDSGQHCTREDSDMACFEPSASFLVKRRLHDRMNKEYLERIRALFPWFPHNYGDLTPDVQCQVLAEAVEFVLTGKGSSEFSFIHKIDAVASKVSSAADNVEAEFARRRSALPKMPFFSHRDEVAMDTEQKRRAQSVTVTAGHAAGLRSPRTDVAGEYRRYSHRPSTVFIPGSGKVEKRLFRQEV
jgi:hypothetical protein